MILQIELLAKPNVCHVVPERTEEQSVQSFLFFNFED